jgi:hypothetical protein
LAYTPKFGIFAFAHIIFTFYYIITYQPLLGLSDGREKNTEFGCRAEEKRGAKQKQL